jgi:phosphatidate cytidylyltransferase
LAIVVSYDVFAYFSGVLFGKKRIAPSISPNKTWEGTLIGAAASLVLAIVIFSLYSLNTSVHSGLDGH